MNRYKAVSGFAQVVGTSSGVISSRYAADLAAGINQKTAFVLIIAVVSFYIISKATNFLFDFAFDHIRFLRRILLGRTYIEGKWFEIISQDDQVLSVGISEFRPDGYGVAFSGAVFDFQGHLKETYCSDIADLNWPTLCVKHSNKSTRKDIPRLEGYGELQFDYRPGKALTYKGFFTHLTQNIRYGVVATKITDPDDLACLNDSNLAKSYIQKKAQQTLLVYNSELDRPTKTRSQNTEQGAAANP